jgi:uncharacterized protein
MPGRLHHLDAMRGVALCGILVIHTVAEGGRDDIPGFGAGSGRPADLAVVAALIWLVESKFFCLFSLLFGVGFALQQPAEPRPGDGRRYARRLLALAGFGVAHVVFVWSGDILLAYAVVGAVLAPFRRCRPRTLVWWAVGLLAMPLLLYVPVVGGVELARLVPAAAAEIETADRGILDELAKPPDDPPTTYLGLMQERVEEYLFVTVLLATRVPTVLAMFLLGLAAERAGVAADPLGHRRLLGRVRLWGLAVGLPLAGLVTVAYLTRPPVSALLSLFFNQALAGPALAVGYAAALALWFARRPAPPLAAYGRMALTNYLSHSVVLYLLFSPDAGGFKGRWSAPALVGMGVGVNLLLIGWSVLWFRRFRYGPLEWLWRAITYGKWPAA